MQITNVGLIYKQFKSEKRFADVARLEYIIQINLNGKSQGEKRKEKKTMIQVLIITKVAKHTI